MKKRKNAIFNRKTGAALLVVCIGILVYVILSNLPAVVGGIGWVLGIISPFIYAIVIAYVLDIPVRFLVRHPLKKLKHSRPVAILIVYAALIVVAVLLILLVVPQLAESVRALAKTVQDLLEEAGTLTESIETALNLGPGALEPLSGDYSDIVDTIVNAIKGAIPQLLEGVVQLGQGLIGAITAIIASVYMLASKGKLLQLLRRVVYAVFTKKWADGIYRVAGVANRIFSGYIGGQVSLSIIIGAATFIFMTVVDLVFLPMPFALLISIIVAVTNLIPFFGPFIGAIPSALILLMVNPWSALVFVIFTIVLQNVEGNFIGPKVLGHSTGIPPLWVLFAIVVGGALFGFWGVLLGVPVLAVIYTLLSEVVRNRLKKKGIDEYGKEMPGEGAGAEAYGEPYTTG